VYVCAMPDLLEVVFLFLEFELQLLNAQPDRVASLFGSASTTSCS
jgi:hypothetical protein